MLEENRIFGSGGALAAYGLYCSVAVGADVVVLENTARQGGALAAFRNGSIIFDTGAIVEHNYANINASIARIDTGGKMTFGR